MHQAKLIYRKRFSFALSGLDNFLFLIRGLHPLLYPYGFSGLKGKNIIGESDCPLPKKPLTESGNSYTVKLCPKDRNIIARDVSPWK